ncbi:MAG TPA: carbohydrate kinase family protein [Chloroflexia bacterium]
MIRLVVCGGLRIDYLITVEGQARLAEIGGNAVYAAGGARVWVDHVGIVARAGTNYPKTWLTKLEVHGIDTSGVRYLTDPQDMRTFYAYIDTHTRVDTEPARHFARIGLQMPAELEGYMHSTLGQDNLETYESLGVRPEDWPRAYAKAKAVHLAPMGIRTHAQLPRYLHEIGVEVITLDPGERYMLPHLLTAVSTILSEVDIFLPSDQEVRSLLGSIDLLEAAKHFAACGPRVVVIKVGSDGALVYERDTNQCWHVPAFPACVVDVTGAGDTFCGGFLAGYIKSGDPIKAALQGAVAASFSIEDYSSLNPFLASVENIKTRLDTLTQRVTRIA